MKKKWLCGILIFVLLLLTSCQAPPVPSADGNESTADSTPSREKQYPYPESTAYSAFFTKTDGTGGKYVCDGVVEIQMDRNQTYYPLLWHNPSTKLLPEAEKNASVSFQEYAFEGTYVGSTALKYDNGLSHRYLAENADFYIHAETGELAAFYLPIEPKNYPPGFVSKEHIKKLAKEYASNFLDVSAYRVESDYVLTNGQSRCAVYFTKLFDGLASAECVTLYYTDDGTFCGYENILPDAFSEEHSWSLTREQSDAVAKALAEDAYVDSLKEKEDFLKISVLFRRFVLTEDGLGLLYTMAVRSNKDHDGCHDTCTLIVFDSAGVTVAT